MKKRGKLYRAIVKGGVLFTFIDLRCLAEKFKREGLKGERASLFLGANVFLAYLASFLKEEGDALILQLKGEEGGKIFAEAGRALTLSGKIEGENFQGGGMLNVTKLARGAPPMGSLFKMQSFFRLKEEFSRYFLQSEQRSCSIYFAEENAAGLFTEPLPGAEKGREKEIFQALTKEENFEKFLLDFKAGFEELLAGEEILFLREIDFRCTCSRAKAKRAALSLGREDAEELLKREGKIEVCCPVCGKKYTFYEEEILRLFNDGRR